ncbi:MAG: exo-alpha-sialidase [Saprospiraceae bacterium]
MTKTLILLIVLISFMACQQKTGLVPKVASLSLNTPSDSVKLFGEGIISTRYNERDMAITSNGDELFYSLGTYNQSLRVIIHLTKKNNQWAEGEVMSWSGRNNDIEPFISPDGKSLFFASNRPIAGDTTREDFNIWVSTKNGDEWTAPIALDTIINTKVDEFYPSVGKSKSLYFTAAHPGNNGKEDIYISKMLDGKYKTPVPLDTNVNSATYEFNAFVSPSEDTIIFSSYGRKDDLGGGDLYISIKNKEGAWQKAHNLGSGINSDGLDYCPFIDYPRHTFYFTSNRHPTLKSRIENSTKFKEMADNTLNGLDNIYVIDLKAVK